MKAGIKWIATALFAVATSIASAQSPSTVLVVANTNNSNSVALANYYMSRRSIPAQNLLLVNWSANDNADTCSLSDYTNYIATPIHQKIATLSHIDYIVLCRNLPSKISDTTGSVDSALAGNTTSKRGNPFHFRSGHFSSTMYGIYLVTRLDGWTWNDAANLVNESIAAAPTRSPFLLDADPTKLANPSYMSFDSAVRMAGALLNSLKCNVSLDTTTAFVGSSVPVAGYASWGSNDSNFNFNNYNNLTFVPGALAETAVSTSGSNIRYPGGGQSQIATLIHNGVTGVKGYVSEPYLDAVANPMMLFHFYTGGDNLAESFYAASAYLGWKDVVIGDPLCGPYYH